MDAPHVCIVMATFNGAAHLNDQLRSFIDQTHGNWSLHISDDGSLDATCTLIDAFRAAHPCRTITRRQGPGRSGSAANFLSLLETGDFPEGAYVALSDQDDIWKPHRLSRALAQLTGAGTGTLAQVYASRTILADAAGQPLTLSWVPPAPAAFENALVQNILPGNTIVLNPVATRVVQRTAGAARQAGVAHHDWWIYLLMTGVGAQVIYDDCPGLWYRQHTANVLGAHRGLSGGFSRLATLWRRDYARWIDANLTALASVAPELRPEHRALASRFRTWRRQEPGRPALHELGVWRQDRAGNMLLSLAARLGRL